MIKRIPPGFVCYTTKISSADAREGEGISIILRVEDIEVSNEQLDRLKDIQERFSAEVNDLMGW